MTTEISDKDFIETFNKFSNEEHLKRYKEYFQSDPKRPGRKKFAIGLEYMTEEEINEYKSMSHLELYDSLYMYMRQEIFDNIIKEELNRKRKVKGEEIDESIKSDLIYEFDNNGNFLGIKRLHQQTVSDEIKTEEKVMCHIPLLLLLVVVVVVEEEEEEKEEEKEEERGD